MNDCLLIAMFSRFISLKIAVFFKRFFFLLTQAEKRAFSQLKALLSAKVSKKKNRNFETWKQLIDSLEKKVIAQCRCDCKVGLLFPIYIFNYAVAEMTWADNFKARTTRSPMHPAR